VLPWPRYLGWFLAKMPRIPHFCPVSRRFPDSLVLPLVLLGETSHCCGISRQRRRRRIGIGWGGGCG